MQDILASVGGVFACSWRLTYRYVPLPLDTWSGTNAAVGYTGQLSHVNFSPVMPSGHVVCVGLL